MSLRSLSPLLFVLSILAPAAHAAPLAPADEAELARATRLPALVKLALARHPDLDASRHRALAAAAMGRAQGRLGAPELK
jgi:outer membrane protein TolC